jgi:UDP-hydrolysing UDP-N-acetyl-D-glucosamine 2-epimerase
MGRLIGIVTSARADFGPLAPLMSAVKKDPDLDLLIYVTGLHFSKVHGDTIREIVDKGFENELVEVVALCPDGSAEETAIAMGDGVSAFARAFTKHRPDVLVVMGDRFDMLPAPIAAVPFNIPIAHISGGEITEGVIDDAIRHATSKFSHIHFASMNMYADNLRQMGEEDWRVKVVGEPGLDITRNYPDQDRESFFADIEMSPGLPLTLFTYHPESLFPEKTGEAISQVLEAASNIETQILFTSPNNDPGSAEILKAITDFTNFKKTCRLVRSLGRHRFFNALAFVDCMVGNSSAGIVESASFKLPTVNIGDRQTGRAAPENVIQTTGDKDNVEASWRRALSEKFRGDCVNVTNPYGDGHASDRIVETLKSIDLGPNLLRKKFFDYASVSRAIR